MQQIQLQLSDQIYDLAQRRATEAGFANLDEYIVDVVMEDLIAEPENLDHRFSPIVLAHLKSIQADIQTGTKTYTEMEVDEFLREKANKWRESHPG